MDVCLCLSVECLVPLLLWHLFSFIFLRVLYLNARKIWKCMCTFLIREDIQRDSAPHTHTHSSTVTIMTDFRKIVRLQCIVCYHKNHRRSILLECAYIRQMTWFCVLFDEMTSHSKRCTLPTHNDKTNKRRSQQKS